MTSRAGRNNGSYAFVPLRLASACPKCGAGRGHSCVRTAGAQEFPIKDTHVERKASRKGRDTEEGR